MSRTRVFKVHTPRNPADKKEMAVFVSNLNRQFEMVSDEFTKRPTINTSDFVTKTDLPSLIEAINNQADQRITSEGTDEVATKSSQNRTSRKRSPDDTAAAAVTNAQPTTAPPNVAAASNIGSTSSPVQFSYADHTHGGVLGNPVAGGTTGQVTFYVSTFEINSDSKLFWDNTNKRLGVGTNAPSDTFSVNEKFIVAGTSGIPTKSANVTTAGLGLPVITDVVSALAQNADIADTALANTSPTGLYRVSVYAETTVGDGAAGTFTVNIKYTDDTAVAHTLTVGPVSLTAAGGFAQATLFIRRATAGITYGVTHTGAFGAAFYDLFVTAERLN